MPKQKSFNYNLNLYYIKIIIIKITLKVYNINKSFNLTKYYYVFYNLIIKKLYIIYNNYIYQRKKFAYLFLFKYIYQVTTKKIIYTT